jgi:hypothetical protein
MAQNNYGNNGYNNRVVEAMQQYAEQEALLKIINPVSGAIDPEKIRLKYN